MNEDEKEQFKDFIISQVQVIVDEQHEANKTILCNFNNDIGVRLENTLPNLLRQFMPNNYWFPLLNSVLGGVVVGLSIYAAITLSQ